MNTKRGKQFFYSITILIIMLFAMTTGSEKSVIASEPTPTPNTSCGLSDPAPQLNAVDEATIQRAVQSLLNTHQVIGENMANLEITSVHGEDN